MIELTATGDTSETLDSLVTALQSLRIEAGGITYDELALRITRSRHDRGLAPAAARVARSTVYDAFRTGRTRINAELVAEIVGALGESESTANQWRLRSLRAKPSTAERRSDSSLGQHSAQPNAGTILSALFIVACLGLNIFGNAASARLSAPLYLDMIGTAIVSVALGPWYGAAVGASSNVLAALSNSPEALPFAVVNVAGALVWGYGVRAWGLGRSPLRFLVLNVVAAVTCTVVAVPILALGFNGTTADDAASGVFTVFQSYGSGLWQAVVASNVTVSLVDKLIAGYVALAVVLWLSTSPTPALPIRTPPVLWALARRGSQLR